MMQANIDGRTLTVTDAKGSSSGLSIKLFYSDDWNGLIKQLCFTNDRSGAMRRISGDPHICRVPEMLADGSSISVYARGLDMFGKELITTNRQTIYPGPAKLTPAQ